MNKLEEARKLIDEADTQIREGFQKKNAGGSRGY